MEKNNSSIRKLLHSFFKDSIWTISALVLMNVVAQFVVYPIWARTYGDEIYGNILYIMSIITVPAVSIGIAANYSRMRESAERETKNGDYNIILLLCGIISGLIIFFLVHISNLETSILEELLASLLGILTMWRYYADVEYRLSLKYKKYFIYYVVVSLGYGIGILLFQVTGLWPLALIPGEAAGLIFVICTGTLFTKDTLKKSPYFYQNLKVVSVLIGSNLISNIIFNGDRFTLELAIGGIAVTIYYLSSLVGKTMSLITTPINSVIIGYLSKFQGQFSKKMVNYFTAITLGAAILGSGVCFIGSYIIIPILYPEQFDTVKSYIIIASVTQVFYFITNIVTTVLLRISNVRAQLIINIIYAALFIGLCIPGALLFGIDGFCIGLLLTNLIRYSIAIFLCYKGVATRKIIDSL